MYVLCIDVCVNACIIGACASVCMYVVCVCVRVYVRMSSCVRLRVAAIRTHLVRPGPVTGDLDLWSLWTRYDGNSKTDP